MVNSSTNSFSHSLNLVDLNDYLGPSQICIKPTQTASRIVDSNSSTYSNPKTEIRLDGHDLQNPPRSSSSSSQPSIEPPTTTLEKAQITLNDCLACSGCITSSESILVSLQSAEEVLKELDRPNRYPIVSISSHSLASFVAYNNLPSKVTGFKVLRKYFQESFKSRLVLDLSFSQRLHLSESQREFRDRRRAESRSQPTRSPILASSCPGWICYAEKTQGKNGILPMISRVKSAQQIQGSLIKSQRISHSIGVSIDQIYHVCIMSCYDKKLEASRSEFQTGQGIKDVDCVLTTREIQDLISKDGFDIHQAARETETEDLTQNHHLTQSEIPIWIDHPEPKGSSSGGYLLNALRASLPTEKKEHMSHVKLVVAQKRGTDYIEYRLQLEQPPVPDKSQNVDPAINLVPETLFFGARFYGFKNLQNLIRKIAPSPSTHPQHPRVLGRRRKDQQLTKSGLDRVERAYDFVEVMACPSGCVNGGGQIPISALPSSTSITAKQWISKLERVYFSTPSHPQDLDSVDHLTNLPIELRSDPQTSIHEEHLTIASHDDDVEAEERRFISNWYKDWGFEDNPMLREQIFCTTYRPVEVETNGFAVQW